jgi:serine/threonine protein kinase
MASALDSDPEHGALSMMGGAGVASIDQFSMPFQPGEVIVGKYKAIRLIGTGGVGFVVSARHVGFDEVVALKFLRPEFASHAEAVMRFTIEARASFKIKSEHVARVLDVDTLADGTPFIVMELLEGSDLRSLLDRRRLLSVEDAVDCGLQVCEALAAAHMLGIIHRDIKPENLFLVGSSDDVDQLKVLDFGISKVALASNGRQTHPALTRIAVGTPPYMSPEQVRASSGLDARSDLWSLGCVLYECLTGTAPFDRLSLMQSCAAVLEEEPSPPRDLRPSIPVELEDAVMRCLQKDATQRFADVALLAETIAPFGSGRFAGYESRCRSFLNGEGPTRLSTPTPIAAVLPIAQTAHTKATVAAAALSGAMASATTATTRRATQDWAAAPNTGDQRQPTNLHAHQPIARSPRVSYTPYTAVAPRTSVGVGRVSPQPAAASVQSAPLTHEHEALPRPRRWPMWIALLTVAMGGLAYYSLRDQIEPAIRATASATPLPAPPTPQPSAGVTAVAVGVVEPAATPPSDPSPSKDTALSPSPAPATDLPVATAAPEQNASKAKPHPKTSTSPSAHKPSAARRNFDEPDVGF